MPASLLPQTESRVDRKLNRKLGASELREWRAANVISMVNFNRNNRIPGGQGLRFLLSLQLASIQLMMLTTTTTTTTTSMVSCYDFVGEPSTKPQSSSIKESQVNYLKGSLMGQPKFQKQSPSINSDNMRTRRKLEELEIIDTNIEIDRLRRHIREEETTTNDEEFETIESSSTSLSNQLDQLIPLDSQLLLTQKDLNATGSSPSSNLSISVSAPPTSAASSQQQQQQSADLLAGGMTNLGPVQELNAVQAANLNLWRHTASVSVILTVAYTIVFIVGIVGNSFVVAIVCKSPRMRTVTNYFIANLAFADILVLLFCLPATLLSNLFVRK